MRPPFIRRVVIKNFKSIAHCDMELGSLQFLVGRNGSGKSNFLDALAFVRDVLEYNSFGKAVETRFGVRQIFNRMAGDEETLGMELDINLGNGITGFLSFELGCDNLYQKLKVIKEECVIRKNGTVINSYQTLDGKVQVNEHSLQFPPVAGNRLYLQNMTIFPEFQLLYDALSSIQIYGANYFRDLGEILAKYGLLVPFDGSIPEILSSILPSVKNRIFEYLQDIVPSISGIDTQRLGDLCILSLSMQHVGELPPGNISNGTLRALGILTVALQERDNDANNFPALVCIEEPETSLHARAMAGILSALEEASEKRQILVTTHSTEMLDNKEITADRILPVELRDSKTVIGPLESVSKEMLNDHLTTAGELLRQNALNPEPSR